MSVFNLVLMGVSICKTYRTIAAMRRIRHSNTHIYIYICQLVVLTPLKKYQSVGIIIPNVWKIKKVFQTTNQYVIIVVVVVINIVPSYSPCFCPYIM